MVLESVITWLVNNLYYIGAFLASLIVSASVFFPLPGILVIILAVTLNLNPFVFSIVSSAGSMIGELAGYYTGVFGTKFATNATKRYLKVARFLEKYFNRYATLTILVTAFLPFPFDLVGIIAGASRYSIPRFLVAGFVGKFFKTLLLLYAVRYSIPIIIRIWSIS